MFYPGTESHKTPTARDAELLGRNALVTGADSVVGSAIAAAFERSGARVVRVPSASDPLDAEAAEAIIAAAIETLGSIDVLVVNPRDGSDDVSESPIDHVLKNNVYPLFRLTKALEPLLRSGVSIITTASTDPAGSPRSVAESKAGLESFMHSLGKALAPRGVRVNGVVPSDHGSAEATARACIRLALHETDETGATLLVA